MHRTTPRTGRTIMHVSHRVEFFQSRVKNSGGVVFQRGFIELFISNFCHLHVRYSDENSYGFLGHDRSPLPLVDKQSHYATLLILPLLCPPHASFTCLKINSLLLVRLPGRKELQKYKLRLKCQHHAHRMGVVPVLVLYGVPWNMIEGLALFFNVSAHQI